MSNTATAVLGNCTITVTAHATIADAFIVAIDGKGACYSYDQIARLSDVPGWMVAGAHALRLAAGIRRAAGKRTRKAV